MVIVLIFTGLTIISAIAAFIMVRGAVREVDKTGSSNRYKPVPLFIVTALLTVTTLILVTLELPKEQSQVIVTGFIIVCTLLNFASLFINPKSSRKAKTEVDS